MTRTMLTFPGQGSQHPGMAADLLRSVPSVRASVAAASARSGIDLVALMARGSAEQLAACEVAQVAVFAVSVGLWRHLDEHGVEPWAVAGHSAGEFAALVAAGVLDEDTALELVVERARAMADAAAATPGAMVAIGGLALDVVRTLCAEVSGRVVVANENSPIQTVVSGELAAVDEVCALARRRGALRVDRLAVGGAFHSPAMEPVRRRMEPLLRAAVLQTPQCVLISSVTGGVVGDVDEYHQRLCEQVTRPVLWSHVVRTARLHGVARFVEVGPGRVLSSLVRSCDREAETLAVRDVPACLQALSLLASAPTAVTA